MIGSTSKYRMTFKCTCGTTFKKITSNRDLVTASCPSCKSKERKTKLIRMGDGTISDHDIIAEKMVKKIMATPEWQEQYMKKALSPITKESQNQNKAVDETARIVMDDYKLGDLKDTVHQGEAAAPKLPHKLQQQADGFFSGKKKNANAFNAGINTGAIARAAMSGAYAPGVTGAINPIAQQHRSKLRAPTKVVASFDGTA